MGILFAFCLVPNHYHMLCETPGGDLGRMMRDLNGQYAQIFNRRHRRVDHLWQARYKAILVQEGEYFFECSRYIHLNPNRSRLTRPAERYRWLRLPQLGRGQSGMRGLGDDVEDSRGVRGRLPSLQGLG